MTDSTTRSCARARHQFFVSRIENTVGSAEGIARLLPSAPRNMGTAGRRHAPAGSDARPRRQQPTARRSGRACGNHVEAAAAAKETSCPAESASPLVARLVEDGDALAGCTDANPPTDALAGGTSAAGGTPDFPVTARPPAAPGGAVGAGDRQTRPTAGERTAAHWRYKTCELTKAALAEAYPSFVADMDALTRGRGRGVAVRVDARRTANGNAPRHYIHYTLTGSMISRSGGPQVHARHGQFYDEAVAQVFATWLTTQPVKVRLAGGAARAFAEMLTTGALTVEEAQQELYAKIS